MQRSPELLAQVAADPGPGARQVYADWWLEVSEPRGEYVALVLALAGRLNRAERARLRARAEALLQAHAGPWTAELRALGAREPRFSQGFVDQVRLTATALAKSLEALMALEPITCLDVELDDPGALVAAMRQPAFARVRRLRLEGNADRLDGRLGSWGLCTGALRSVTLWETSDLGLRALARSPDLVGLERLCLSGTSVRDQGLVELAGSPLRLLELYAARTRAGDAGVVALVSSSVAERLETLALDGNTLGEVSVRALTASPHLTRLRRLELGGTGLPAHVLAPLASRSALPSLRTLDLAGSWYRPEALEALSARLGTGLRL